MCLKTIKKVLKEPQSGFGWKIFRKKGPEGNLYSQWYSFGTPRKRGVWLRSRSTTKIFTRSSGLRPYDPGLRMYDPGFHIYANKPTGHFTNGLVVVKVEYRGGHTIGTDYAFGSGRRVKVIVARRMKIPAQDEE